MKTSYPEWQGSFTASIATRPTAGRRFVNSLSGLILTFLAAYFSVVILHSSDADRLNLDQPDFVMTSEAISEEC